MSKRKRPEEDPISFAPSPIICSQGSCHNNPHSFSTYLEFEMHVQNFHTHICRQCRKKFPSDALLSLHIEENHDPLFQLKRERGDKVYRCLKYADDVPCGKLCADRKKRRLHMIDKHGYPRDWDFSIIDKGIRM